MKKATATSEIPIEALSWLRILEIEQFKLRALASFWNCRRPQQKRDWNLQGKRQAIQKQFGLRCPARKAPYGEVGIQVVFYTGVGGSERRSTPQI